MTEHEPGDLIGVFANKLQVELPYEAVSDGHSFRSVAPGVDHSAPGETCTVTIEADFTYFEYRGEVYMFDGVTYRPNSEYRDDTRFLDGEVKLKHPNGIYPDLGHRLNPEHRDIDVAEFIELLVRTALEPTENPDH